MTQQKRTKKQEVENTEMKQCDIFTIVKKNNECYVCLGNEVMAQQKFKTIPEAEKYIRSKPYELLINATCYVIDYIKKTNKIKEEN